MDAMRLRQLYTRALRAALLLGAAACGTPTGEAGEVRLSLSVQLRASNGDIGPTAATIHVFVDSVPVVRSTASRRQKSTCTLSQTPESSCVYDVPTGRTVSLIATEGDPHISFELRPSAPEDTAHSGLRVEFINWTVPCESEPEPGVCVFTARDDITIGAVFQFLTLVVVYQTGTGALDYHITAQPMLKLPPESSNLLNGFGCTRLPSNAEGNCDPVRTIGGEPWHRFTIHLPDGATLLLRPTDGEATEFREFDAPCSYFFAGGRGCALRASASEVTSTPMVLTFRYEYWDCPAGPSPRDEPMGSCTLVRP